MAVVITSDGLIDWFVQCGLITMGQKVRRVVIDAQAGEVAQVYIELFGTAEMLNAALPEFSTGQITIVGK